MKEKEQYLEKNRHGSPGFPVEYYDCVYPAGLAGLPVHWHEEFEITWVRGGKCMYFIDLQPVPVEEGDFLFLPSGVLHGIPEGKTDFLETDSFVFHPEMLGGPGDVCRTRYLLPVERGEIRFPFVISGKEAVSLRQVFGRLKKVFLQKESGYELEVKALLLQLTALLFQSVPFERKIRENRQVVEKLKTALQYIQGHYQQPVTVGELAELCHFSEYYFMRFFKQYMNMTCIEYLNQYRIKIAAGKLADTAASVTDIALDTGFNNLSYFNRVFKKSFGMTPGEYSKAAARPGAGERGED